MRIASWNKRAKYYVITEPGEKGIQARTNVGEPPPKDCKLKNCSGEEWKEHAKWMEEVTQDKKKELEDTPDISFNLKQNENDGMDKKESWFNSIFGD